MYSKGKVIPGLLIFIALVSCPVWKRFIVSPAAAMPKPVIANGDHCVESREYMRAKHMVLLNNWRNEVVRENNKVYINSRGEHFQKSLTGTCLKCHSNKEQFCDSCHKAADVKPYCFDCHLSGGGSHADHKDGEEKNTMLPADTKNIKSAQQNFTIIHRLKGAVL
ncbi:MAG: sulfate reduction electron transfer complex DsrMKJOP subunit DsrJ [Spirochaetia bacterium]|nr:sulfate reduction electron transfer complex DsrMKJOP subunit DsrJ [Spirochaetia bacterium]